METSLGHLSYCTNIHAGESWNEHFESLERNIPLIKAKVSPAHPFGIGLRLSNVLNYIRKNICLHSRIGSTNKTVMFLQ
jgi:hypothetical protein